MPITIDPMKLLEFGTNGIIMALLCLLAFMVWKVIEWSLKTLQSTIETNQKLVVDSARTQAEITVALKDVSLALKGVCDMMATGFAASTRQVNEGFERNGKSHTEQQERIEEVGKTVRGLKGGLGGKRNDSAS